MNFTEICKSTYKSLYNQRLVSHYIELKFTKLKEYIKTNA